MRAVFLAVVSGCRCCCPVARCYAGPLLLQAVAVALQRRLLFVAAEEHLLVMPVVVMHEVAQNTGPFSAHVGIVTAGCCSTFPVKSLQWEGDSALRFRLDAVVLLTVHG